MANDTVPWTKNNPNASSEWVLYDSADDGDPAPLVDTWKTGEAAVTKTVSDSTQAVVNTYNAATKTVGDAVNTAGDFVKDTGEKMADTAGDVVDGAGKLVGNAKDTVVEHLPGPLQGFLGNLI
jgi:hypothetical protein